MALFIHQKKAKAAAETVANSLAGWWAGKKKEKSQSTHSRVAGDDGGEEGMPTTKSAEIWPNVPHMRKVLELFEAPFALEAPCRSRRTLAATFSFPMGGNVSVEPRNPLRPSQLEARRNDRLAMALDQQILSDALAAPILPPVDVRAHWSLVNA